MSNQIPPWAYDEDQLQEVADRLVLRSPNKAAISAILARLQDAEPSKASPIEITAVLATAVGKTYVLAGLIDYLARFNEIRNFLVVVPSKTILRKTLDQLTPGHPKYLPGDASAGQDLGGSRMRVITKDNYTSSRSDLHDPSTVKVFLFTVQALIKPSDESARRLHEDHEMLDRSLYEHLRGLPDLVVLADESHNYEGGRKFSDAIRDLRAPVLIGLTGTPGKGDENDTRLVYRYGLAHALLGRYIKAPVIVGRSDEASDEKTKLYDGLTLLERKQQAIDLHVRKAGIKRVNPIMLVVAASQEHAQEIRETLNSKDMFDGRFGSDDACLVITSDTIDEATAERLANVEDPGSPVRVIIHVAMLKEGWDIKNVFVLVVLRSSTSEILTEQTIGRGLRLPWGRWISTSNRPDENLDTLEIVAHDQYKKLLETRTQLTSSLIDYQHPATQAVGVSVSLEADPISDPWARHVAMEGMGPQVVHSVPSSPLTRDETLSLSGDPLNVGIDGTRRQVAKIGTAAESPIAVIDGLPVAIVDMSDRRIAMERDLAEFELVSPQPAVLPISLKIPTVAIRSIAAKPGLHHVIDMASIHAVARQFNVDAHISLDRTILLGSEVDSETATTIAITGEPVEVERLQLPFDDAEQMLIGSVQNATAIAAHKQSKQHAERIVGEFISALDHRGKRNLPFVLSAAARRLVEEVNRQAVESAGPGTYEPEAPTWNDLPSRERHLGAVEKSAEWSPQSAYTGWRACAYETCTFDSSTERSAALILDKPGPIEGWVRLDRQYMSITWKGGQRYFPDFLAIEGNGDEHTIWVIEVKADNRVADDEVQAKKKAAHEWCAHVSAHSDYRWIYLLVTEQDIEQCGGSWEQLKAFGQKRG